MRVHWDEGDGSAPGSCDPEALAKRFSLFGTVMLLAYGALALSAMLPLRLLDPRWQIHCIDQLVLNAPLPLIGLGLIHLAVYVDPLDIRLVRYRDRVARLALPVAFGFLLSVPLLLVASLQRAPLPAQLLRRHGEAIRELDAIQEAVRGAASTADLRQRLARIQAPPLLPADASRPMAPLKRKLLADVDAARQSIDATLKPAARPSRRGLLAAHLRTVVMALAFALAFASGAQGQRSLRSPLEEWSIAWRQARELARRRRRIRREFRHRLRRLRAERLLRLRMASWQSHASTLPERHLQGFDPTLVEELREEERPAAGGPAPG